MRNLILSALIWGMASAGCSSAQDNREKIAFAALYDEKGALNTKLFSIALMEKLAALKSSPRELESIVKSLGGSCRSGNDEAAKYLVCSLPQTAAVCIESFVRISAFLSESTITSIQAEQVLRGC